VQPLPQSLRKNNGLDSESRTITALDVERQECTRMRPLAFRKEAELNVLNHGVTVLPESSNGHGVLLAAAIQDFLDEKRVQRKLKTYA